eukprot:gene637-biopygen18151
MSGAGGARAWRGHGAGMSCSPRSLRAHHTHGEARRGVARLRGVGKARHGAAQRGTAQCGAAQSQRDAARRSTELCGAAQHRAVRRGSVAQRGTAWRGAARRGAVSG